METSHTDYHRRNDSNVLGVVGFVLSFTCILAFVGLPMSLFALRKRPRGFAIAGTIFGLIWVGIQVTAFVMASIFAKEHNYESAKNFWVMLMDSTAISQEATNYKLKNGEFPETINQLTLDEKTKTDPWGTPYRLTLITDRQGNLRMTARSAGTDRAWDTEDDLTPLMDAENDRVTSKDQTKKPAAKEIPEKPNKNK